jgi:hypothetical protein
VRDQLHQNAAVHLQRLEAERRELQRLHTMGVSLQTLARMSGRSVQSLSRLLRGNLPTVAAGAD